MPRRDVRIVVAFSSATKKDNKVIMPGTVYYAEGGEPRVCKVEIESEPLGGGRLRSAVKFLDQEECRGITEDDVLSRDVVSQLRKFLGL